VQPADKRRVRIAIFLTGVAALIGVTAHAGASTVVHILGTLRLFGLVTITLLHLPVIVLMGLAWWCVGRDAGRPSIFIGTRLVRDSAAEILPFSQIGGFLCGLRLLALAGSNVRDGAFTMLADLILEFSAKLFYTLLGIVVLVWLLPSAQLIRPFSIALICLFTASAAVMFFWDRFKAVLKRLSHWGIRKWAPLRYDENIELSITHAEAWVTLRLMGIAVNGAQALVIDSLVTAFRSLGFLVPAALGVQEAGYVLVCALFGIPPAGAIAFSLSRRARDLLLGLVGLSIWQALEIHACRRHPQREG